MSRIAQNTFKWFGEVVEGTVSVHHISPIQAILLFSFFQFPLCLLFQLWLFSVKHFTGKFQALYMLDVTADSLVLASNRKSFSTFPGWNWKVWRSYMKSHKSVTTFSISKWWINDPNFKLCNSTSVWSWEHLICVRNLTLLFNASLMRSYLEVILSLIISDVLLVKY